MSEKNIENSKWTTYDCDMLENADMICHKQSTIHPQNPRLCYSEISERNVHIK